MITMSTLLVSCNPPVVSGTYLKSAELLFLLQCTVDALCSKMYSVGLQLFYIQVVHIVHGLQLIQNHALCCANTFTSTEFITPCSCRATQWPFFQRYENNPLMCLLVFIYINAASCNLFHLSFSIEQILSTSV